VKTQLSTLLYNQQLPKGTGIDDHYETADFIILIYLGQIKIIWLQQRVASLPPLLREQSELAQSGNSQESSPLAKKDQAP
jgi:hypothetical protein